jgi:hypothetical protein
LNFIEKEETVENKVFLFKEVIYIFFRIDSLNNFYQENITNNEIFLKNSPVKLEHNEINLNTESNNNLEKNNWKKEKEKDINEFIEDDLNKKNLSKTLLCLHKFLRENDVESWIKCLQEESAYFKGVKEINGQVFTMINQYAATYYQTGKILDFKSKYLSIMNIYGERAKEKNREKNPEKILIEMKARIELAIDIYKKLIKKENEIFELYDKENNNNQKNNLNSNNIENDENNSNKFLIKIFFKHALYQLNKQSNNNINNIDDDQNIENSLSNIKSQIELALKLLENNQFDISSINILDINSDLAKSIKILFENIKMIRNKKEVEKAFKNWKMKGLGYYKMSEKMSKSYLKSEIYFKNLKDELTKGKKI